MTVIKHENQWWWGTSVNIISSDCKGIIEVQFEKNSTVAHLNNLSVIANSRGKKYGTSLMRIAEDIAREKGSEFLRLNVDKNNPSLVRWYNSLGFIGTYTEEHELQMIKKL